MKRKRPIPDEEQLTTELVTFRGPQPLWISYGIGVDSTAMLVGLWERGIRPDGIMFADTGGEWPETYEFARKWMRPWLQLVGFPDIARVVKRSPICGDRTLEEECRRKKMLPSIAYRYKRSCSVKWKHKPMDAYCANQPSSKECWKHGYRVIRAIGFDASEKYRTYRAPGDDPKYRYWFPLQEWGWTREDCESAIVRAGLPVPKKSACFFCSVSKRDEIITLAEKHPELARRAMEMEQAALPNLKEIKGLGVDKPWTPIIMEVLDEE